MGVFQTTFSVSLQVSGSPLGVGMAVAVRAAELRPVVAGQRGGDQGQGGDQEQGMAHGSLGVG